MKDIVNPSFMLIPSMACQASCSYCFGPHSDHIMNHHIARRSIDFIHCVATETCQKKISITFHGGEPLLTPFSLWKFFLSEIVDKLGGFELGLHVQSNLWALDDKLAQLYQKYNVSVSTSIDGPRQICDMTRGNGYYFRTMKGISKAREYGLIAGGIATLTSTTYQMWKEVVEFFIQNNMDLNLHQAVPGLDSNVKSEFAMNSDEYIHLLKELFPHYLMHRKVLSITTLDHFPKGLVNNDPEVCTFKDCFGSFLVISPDGSINHCQRFSGKQDFIIGNVQRMPTLNELYQHPTAKMIIHREKQVAIRCAHCKDYEICRGGCYYNALTAGDGVLDHFCKAYQWGYNYVRKQLEKEMASDDNLKAIASRRPNKNEHPLLRKGSYISLTKHQRPKSIAATARKIMGMYELARANNPTLAAHSMIKNKYSGDLDKTIKIMKHYLDELRQPQSNLNNLYLHITFRCNLKCTHCYSGFEDNKIETSESLFQKFLVEAFQTDFKKVVITGGEPLIHLNILSILKSCNSSRNGKKRLALRSNFTGDYSSDFMKSIGFAFDQVIVSIDGNAMTHNNRRGDGTYENLIKNLECYQNIYNQTEGIGELIFACVMETKDINGEPGKSIQDLASRLGVSRISYRPILPLGRAVTSENQPVPEGTMEYLTIDELLESGFQPQTTCGLGQNLYIKPDGVAFPCYALHQTQWSLGNIEENGLENVLSARKFQELRECTVDTLDGCNGCDYRYLCGGACRAWGNEENLKNLYAAPPRCDHLKNRTQSLVARAKKYLKDTCDNT